MGRVLVQGGVELSLDLLGFLLKPVFSRVDLHAVVNRAAVALLKRILLKDVAWHELVADLVLRGLRLVLLIP